MNIQTMPLEALQADTRNARQHDEVNLKAITDSLQSFGQVEPLVMQKGTHRIIGGNGRLEAMKALGWTQAKVVEVDVSDAKATALAIALNRTGELANWDLDRLEKNLQSIKDDVDLTTLGFDENDLSQLLGQLEEEQEDQEVFSAPAAGGPSPGGPSPQGLPQQGGDGGDETNDPAPYGGDPSPRSEPDPARQSSPPRQLRPVALAYPQDEIDAFFRVAEEAEVKLKTSGLSDTVLAALRSVVGQSIF